MALALAPRGGGASGGLTTIAAAPRAEQAHCQRTAGDRCPGVLDLHEAQDGGLARVRVPGGRVSSRQLAAIAAAAAHGNGLVELTSRANLQIRGVGEAARAAVTELLWQAGMLPSIAHDRARNVLVSPLAGRHAASLCGTDDVVLALDRGLCADPALAALSGRFLFAIDDGSGLALGHGADVTLIASDGQTFGVLLAGTATTLSVASGRAAEVALDAARAFVELRGECGAWRLRELPDGAERVAARLGGELTDGAARAAGPRGAEQGRTASISAGPRSTAPRVLAPGVYEQRDGRAAVTVLAPLGRLERDAIAGLAALLGEDGEVRVSPWRMLSVLDVEPPRVAALTSKLEALGLVASADSGWERLSACAGLGACAKARIDVRAAAAERARMRAVGAGAEHWSGCERRCGEPTDAAVAVAALDDGVAVSLHGAERVVAAPADALALLAGRGVAR